MHVFAPALSREAYAGGQLETLAERLTGGSFAPLLTHLVEQRRYQIERDMNTVISARQKGHIEIVFEGVKAHPGHQQPFSLRFPVIGLMHMP